MGIVSLSIDPAKQSGSLEEFEKELNGFGLMRCITSSEGTILDLPKGTYGTHINPDNLIKEHKKYYRTIIEIMKKHRIKGKYYLNVSSDAEVTCGKL